MARKVNSRTVLNRRALDALSAGFVDGMEAMGQAFVDTIQVPDAPPFGEGLIDTPDWGVWSNGRKVAGTATKPRQAKVKTGITLIAGEGFPGRFVELGTIDTPSEPHVTPAMLSVLSGSAAYIKPAVRAKLSSAR